VIRLLTTFTSKRYRNICNLSRDFMQIRIRHLYRAAPETIQRATHAYKGRYFLDSVPVSVIFRAIQLADNVLLKLKIISYIQR